MSAENCETCKKLVPMLSYEPELRNLQQLPVTVPWQIKLPNPLPTRVAILYYCIRILPSQEKMCLISEMLSMLCINNITRSCECDVFLHIFIGSVELRQALRKAR